MTIKLGSKAVLLCDLVEPDAGECLPSGSKVTVCGLSGGVADVRSGSTVGRVSVDALKATRGRPAKLRPATPVPADPAE